jgi:acetyl-CoA carboxylase carboxyltransferase component
MGGAAAASTLLSIDLAARKRRGEDIDDTEREQLLAAITASYKEQENIFYGAARGWVDRMIDPEETRQELIEALSISSTFVIADEFKTGVLQT